MEARVRSQVSSCEMYGGQSGTGTGFTPSTSFFPCEYHSTIASYSSSPARCSSQNNERAKPGNLSKSNAVSEIGENWLEKYFCLFKTFNMSIIQDNSLLCALC